MPLAARIRRTDAVACSAGMPPEVMASVISWWAGPTTSVPDSSAMSAPAAMARRAASSWGTVLTTAPIPRLSVITSPSNPWRPRSSSVIAARERLAGSSSPVRPGTVEWATMIAGTPAAIARSKGTRSRERSWSTGASASRLMWGSAPPPPMPGQCLSTEVIPACCCASTMATAKSETTAGSSPKERVPRSDPLPTSATGPKFMLKPRSTISAAYCPMVVAASSGVSSANSSAEGRSPSARRRRCTVPPSSSLATNGATGASSMAAAISAPMSAD